MTSLEVGLQVAVMALLVLSVLLYIIPGPCICPSCSFHRNQRVADAARKRERAHENRHLLWGDRDTCTTCNPKDDR